MKRRAFTLIELLIVVAIISILAAIAIPNFLHAQIRAKIARSLADMHSIGTAVECFRADTQLDLCDWWDSGDPINQEPKYVAIGYAHTTLYDLTIPSRGRSMNIVYNVLTTPLAYIAAIPRDPFLRIKSYTECLALHIDADACRVLNALVGTYMYADRDGHQYGGAPVDHNVGAFWPAYAPTYGLRPMQIGEWVILGVGPDDRPESVNLYQRRGIPYDPSNGLISQGDLFVRSSGEVSNGGAR